MSCQIYYKNKKLTISVDGMFTNKLWQKINEFQVDWSEITECEVDFSKTIFVDSGGLGCLILLKEKLGYDVNVSITNTNRDVHKIITTTNLDSIFTVV
ncbi:MAG: STAS domain-containing protein [Magnetococcales bacterium]|nr:STAS domain-containing protein [Magnetococcales bacterium]